MLNVTPDGLSAVGMSPLLNPPSEGWHGLSNDDCVTEWLRGLNANSTTVPTGSRTSLGANVSAPAAPTSTRATRLPPTGRPFGGDVLGPALFALSRNAAKVFPVAGALMLCSMPCWQWLPWPQKIHTGFVSLIVIVKVVVEGVVSEAEGVKAEKKPPARGAQGLSKEDWVTEWF